MGSGLLQFRKLKCCSFIFTEVTDFQFIKVDFADVALFFGFQLQDSYKRITYDIKIFFIPLKLRIFVAET